MLDCESSAALQLKMTKSEVLAKLSNKSLAASQNIKLFYKFILVWCSIQTVCEKMIVFILWKKIQKSMKLCDSLVGCNPTQNNICLSHLLCYQNFCHSKIKNKKVLEVWKICFIHWRDGFLDSSKTQGSFPRSWKILENSWTKVFPEKVMENVKSHGKSWKSWKKVVSHWKQLSKSNILLRI